MNLPGGVSYHPRQERLIAKDEQAVIQIETGVTYPNKAQYNINDRSFVQAIQPFLRGDWGDFDRQFQLDRPPVVYSGAEYRSQPKLPNITVVPNLSTKKKGSRARPPTVFGCTMGHYHPRGEKEGERIQEVYEFQSYGLMVLNREQGEAEMWVAKDGDKVAVPNGCHMTLYNLDDGDHPLITLDFADPDRNPAHKDVESRYGPILLAYYDDAEVVFVLNRLYVNNRRNPSSLQVSSTARQNRQVSIKRGARMGLGQLLYEQLTQNPDVIGRFAQLGIRIKPASSEAVVAPLPSGGQCSRLYVSLPLVQLTQPGTDLYRYFFPTAQEAQPDSAKNSIAAVEMQIVQEKERRLRQENPHRPQVTAVEGTGESVKQLVIIVEGAGDWVSQCYRPLFKKKVAQGKNLRVYYADDMRWKESRPAWTDPNHKDYDLQPWETYLDKADARDLALYLSQRPDVVFVVTPDFTHSEIASEWVRRKVPTVFVEKPFDSQHANVYKLLQELGRQPDTAILGLDHYQFYALPIHDLKSAIEEHLGGALARVAFYMTEDRPIELGRERSLQFGLTLDMLPHLPALLTYFGDPRTIDQIEVLEAGQYEPLIAVSRDGGEQKDISQEFIRETYSKVMFTFQDYSGNGYHVPCLAVVGKGCAQEVKYLEVIGRNGNAIRVDLNKPPDPNQHPDYPWGYLFFLMGDKAAVPPGTQVRTVKDPYDPSRTLCILEDPGNPTRFCRSLERARYEKLLDDLLNGTNDAVASTLSRLEAPEIVRALDRIWRAIQESQPWIKYHLRGTLSTRKKTIRSRAAARR